MKPLIFCVFTAFAMASCQEDAPPQKRPLLTLSREDVRQEIRDSVAVRNGFVFIQNVGALRELVVLPLNAGGGWSVYCSRLGLRIVFGLSYENEPIELRIGGYSHAPLSPDECAEMAAIAAQAMTGQLPR